MVLNNLLDKIQLLSYSLEQKCFHHETLGEALENNYELVTRGGGGVFLPIFASFGDGFSIEDRKIIDKIYDVIRPEGAPHSDGGYHIEE